MTDARGDSPIDTTGLTFGQFVDEAGRRFGDRSGDDRERSIVGRARDRSQDATASSADDVHALQAALMAEGVKPGDRVGVMLSSLPEWVLYLFAVTRLGAAFVPINTRFRKSSSCTHVLEHSGSSTLVAMGDYLERDYAATIAEVIGDWRSGRWRFAPRARTDDRRAHFAASAGARNGMTARARYARRSRRTARRLRRRTIEATAVLFYTSGTTAFPKGVPLTHRNLLPHSVGMRNAASDSRPADRVLTLYPFFGISGGANKVLSTLGCGACLVFQDAFRADEAFALLEDREAAAVMHARRRAHARAGARCARRRARGACRRSGAATIAFTAGVDEGLARGRRRCSA